MKSSVGVNRSGVASVTMSSIFILFAFATFPLSRYCLFSVQQSMSLVLVFFIALGPNQYDAFKYFNPIYSFFFFNDAFSNFSCPQMAWQETCALLGHTAHPALPHLSPVLQELTATWVGWEASMGAWTAHLGEYHLWRIRLSSVSLQRDCSTPKFVARAAHPYLQPSYRGVSSVPKALVQMHNLRSPWLHTCISRFTIRNLDCLSCPPVFTVHWLLSRLIMSVVQDGLT